MPRHRWPISQGTAWDFAWDFERLVSYHILQSKASSSTTDYTNLPLPELPCDDPQPHRLPLASPAPISLLLLPSAWSFPIASKIRDGTADVEAEVGITGFAWSTGTTPTVSLDPDPNFDLRSAFSRASSSCNAAVVFGGFYTYQPKVWVIDIRKTYQGFFIWG